MTEKYLVLYARVVDDKKMGALMTGVFFGGVCDTEEEAEILAERCVSETQGGIIIPRVARMDTDDLRVVVRSLEDQFDTMADRMYETEKIIGKKRSGKKG